MFGRSAAAFGFVVGVLGCGFSADSTSPSSPTRKAGPVSIVIAPVSGPLARGDTLVLSAQALDQEDRVVPNAVFAWGSSEPGIATVTSRGIVYGLRAGSTIITAASAAAMARITLTITDPYAVIPVFISIVQLPPLIAGEVAQLTATVYNQFAEHIDSAVVEWSTTDTSVATVAASGQLRAKQPGSTMVRAQTGTVADSAIVRVDEAPAGRIDGARSFVPGSEAQLRIVPAHPNRSASTVTATEWRSSDASIAFVSSTGLVSARREGRATITAETSSGLVSTDIVSTRLPGRIVYVSGGRVMGMYLDGRAPTELTVIGRTRPVSTALASFDGTQLAMDCSAVCRASLGGAQLVPLQVGEGIDPSISADGAIVVALISEAEFVVYGREVEARPLALRWEGRRPRVSPDGRRILYECSYRNPYVEPNDLCLIAESGTTSLLVCFLGLHSSESAMSEWFSGFASLRNDGLTLSTRPAHAPDANSRCHSRGVVRCSGRRYQLLPSSSRSLAVTLTHQSRRAGQSSSHPRAYR